MSKNFFFFMVTRATGEGGGLVRGRGQNVVISARCALFPAPSHNRCHLSKIFFYGHMSNTHKSKYLLMWNANLVFPISKLENQGRRGNGTTPGALYSS